MIERAHFRILQGRDGIRAIQTVDRLLNLGKGQREKSEQDKREEALSNEQR